MKIATVTEWDETFFLKREEELHTKQLRSASEREDENGLIKKLSSSTAPLLLLKKNKKEYQIYLHVHSFIIMSIDTIWVPGHIIISTFFEQFKIQISFLFKTKNTIWNVMWTLSEMRYLWDKHTDFLWQYNKIFLRQWL